MCAAIDEARYGSLLVQESAQRLPPSESTEAELLEPALQDYDDPAPDLLAIVPRRQRSRSRSASQRPALPPLQLPPTGLSDFPAPISDTVRQRIARQDPALKRQKAADVCSRCGASGAGKHSTLACKSDGGPKPVALKSKNKFKITCPGWPQGCPYPLPADIFKNWTAQLLETPFKTHYARIQELLLHERGFTLSQEDQNFVIFVGRVALEEKTPEQGFISMEPYISWIETRMKADSASRAANIAAKQGKKGKVVPLKKPKGSTSTGRKKRGQSKLKQLLTESTPSDSDTAGDSSYDS